MKVLLLKFQISLSVQISLFKVQVPQVLRLGLWRSSSSSFIYFQFKVEAQFYFVLFKFKFLKFFYAFKYVNLVFPIFSQVYFDFSCNIFVKKEFLEFLEPRFEREFFAEIARVCGCVVTCKPTPRDGKSSEYFVWPCSWEKWKYDRETRIFAPDFPKAPSLFISWIFSLVLLREYY